MLFLYVVFKPKLSPQVVLYGVIFIYVFFSLFFLPSVLKITEDFAFKQSALR